MLFLVEACQDVEILKLILYIKLILKYACIIVPILLIIMMTFDFVKNVLASKEDEMKKNQKIAIKRIIYAVALFFVMPIVNVIFGLPGLNELGYIECWNHADENYIRKQEEKSSNIEEEKNNDEEDEFKIASFDANGGKLNGNDNVGCKGKKCTITNLPLATKSGYTFEGWSSKKNCTKDGKKNKITLTKDKTFYACWGKEN